jgi:hypothetical protein
MQVGGTNRNAPLDSEHTNIYTSDYVFTSSQIITLNAIPGVELSISNTVNKGLGKECNVKSEKNKE